MLVSVVGAVLLCDPGQANAKFSQFSRQQSQGFNTDIKTLKPRVSRERRPVKKGRLCLSSVPGTDY